MALSGMTGFARADGERDGVRWVWEARSVNGRALDVKLRLPPGFDALEQTARDAAAKRFKRGSLQVSLSLKQEAAATAPPKINLGLLEWLIAQGKPHIEAGKATAPSWDGLLALRGVLSVEETEPDALAAALQEELSATLMRALDALRAARRQEGAKLHDVLATLVARIEARVVEARATAAAQPAAIQQRILQRLENIASDLKLDPQRVAQEAAVAAMRADVQEELERLSAHAVEARALISSGEAAGRRLDFLAQEFAREANTLCSKSQDMALTRLGLDLKAAIDQLKEQAANVE